MKVRLAKLKQDKTLTKNAPIDGVGDIHSNFFINTLVITYSTNVLHVNLSFFKMRFSSVPLEYPMCSLTNFTYFVDE